MRKLKLFLQHFSGGLSGKRTKGRAEPCNTNGPRSLKMGFHLMWKMGKLAYNKRDIFFFKKSDMNLQ